MALYVIGKNQQPEIASEGSTTSPWRYRQGTPPFQAPAKGIPLEEGIPLGEENLMLEKYQELKIKNRTPASSSAFLK